MEVSDGFFSGRVGWAEQLLFSIQTQRRANLEFRHPRLLNEEVIDQATLWSATDEEINIKADYYLIPQLLVNRPTMAKRVRAYTPTRAIDVGIDRDLAATFTGIPIPPNLMVDRQIDTLEERTAYLLQAKSIYDEMVFEWNLFADIQENLWLKIYEAEGLLSFSRDDQSPGAEYHFSMLAGFAGTGIFSGLVLATPGYIRNVSRLTYESAVTQWLLDSGTTARTGGIAVDNDSYVLWLASQLSTISASREFVAKKSIDPRVIYRYNPVLPQGTLNAANGGDGVSGVPDSGSPDPANDNSPAQNLLEELAGKDAPLTAELGGGLSTAPINTLPEC